MMRSRQQVPLETPNRVWVYHPYQRCVEWIVIYGDDEVTEGPVARMQEAIKSGVPEALSY